MIRQYHRLFAFAACEGGKFISNVDFWQVGSTQPIDSELTVSEISGHLAADWLPSVPTAVAESLVGWPSFLLEVDSGRLTMHPRAGRCERQWKSVLSWMLGVAGTRHFLKKEGFRWIAPVSGFLATAKKDIDLAGWSLAFPRTTVRTARNINSNAKLMPDYIALKHNAKMKPAFYEWAVAEAKGTRDDLSNQQVCPSEWYNQVQNVTLRVANKVRPLDRHIVIATRVNPNAKKTSTRRLQIRAWNKQNSLVENAGAQASGPLMIVAAHLFGFFRVLRLRATAVSIAFAAQRWSARAITDQEPDLFDEVTDSGYTFANRAAKELERLRGQSLDLETEAGTLEITLAEPLIELTKTLLTLASIEEAQPVLEHAEEQLDLWNRDHAAQDPSGGVLPFGMKVTWLGNSPE